MQVEAIRNTLDAFPLKYIWEHTLVITWISAACDSLSQTDSWDLIVT